MTRINWRTPTDAGFEEAGKSDFIAATIYLVDVLSPGDEPVQQNQTRILTLSGRLCSDRPVRVLDCRRAAGAPSSVVSRAHDGMMRLAVHGW
ncbi:hypothetical protein A8H39_33685 [Paraburkholderia fungorum]|nr:hypothetical protein A8H39_33685 [Paraburkholderia fungorum]